MYECMIHRGYGRPSPMFPNRLNTHVMQPALLANLIDTPYEQTGAAARADNRERGRAYNRGGGCPPRPQYNGCGWLDWCVVLYVVWCGVMSCDALSCPVVPNIVLPCHVFHSRTENEMRMGRRQNGDAEDGLQLIQLSCGRTEHSSLSCPHQNLAQDV